MKIFTDLRRRIYSSQQFTPDKYLPWKDYLGQYGSNAVVDISADYSKIRAVSKLPDILQNISLSEGKALLCALLTDRGLLFAQTRERFYSDPRYSRANYINEALHSNAFARSLGDGRMSTLNHILASAKKRYQTRKAGFEESYPLVSYNRVETAIRQIFGTWNKPFSSFELHNTEDADAGYCRGRLSSLKISNDESKERLGKVSDEVAKEMDAIMIRKMEAVMAEWLSNTYMVLDDSGPTNVGFYAGETLGFNTFEAFEFFVYILLECISNEKMRMDTWVGKYTPALASNQRELFLQQLADFQAEDLSAWKDSLPALKQYLYPDLDQFNGNFSIGQDYDEANQSSISKLEHAFSTYLASVEPCSSRKRQRETTSLCKEAATFFISARFTSDGPLLFVDKPAVIFHLFRSPVHRRICKWTLPRDLRPIIDDACTKYPLPITRQSIDADRQLYHKIVDVCSEVCKRHGRFFPVKAWNALWQCISQSVDCLSFRMEDLTSVQRLFHGLMSPRRLQFNLNWDGYLVGYFILDRWLEQKLYSVSPPIYIYQWRLLMNKLANSSHTHNDYLQKAVKTYRFQFETSDSPNLEAVWKCLKPLCRKIDWSTIKVLPSLEEINFVVNAAESDIKPAIPSELQETILNIIKTSNMPKIPGDKEATPVKSLRAVYMEWLLLQCVCGQAQRELMEAVYHHLTKTAEDPA